MTKAKLDVMRLPLRRSKNQIRDSDFPSDIKWARHIFQTYLTYWRSTATVCRLQRRDKTKKHTEQAQRISDAWDQRYFKTLWSAARAMLPHPCGPKRRRYDIPLSSLPTAAEWATHLRQAGPLGRCWVGGWRLVGKGLHHTSFTCTIHPSSQHQRIFSFVLLSFSFCFHVMISMWYFADSVDCSSVCA